MRFRIRQGGPARRFRFDRRPAAAPPPIVPDARRAALDNPYGRYYSRPRSLEDLRRGKEPPL